MNASVVSLDVRDRALSRDAAEAVRRGDWRGLGWIAWHQRKVAEANPYPTGSVAAKEWALGYRDARQENS